MSLTRRDGDEHEEQQRGRRLQQQQQHEHQDRKKSVRFGGATDQMPSAADDLAAPTRRSMRGARREGSAGEAYPWLSRGAVGRPRPAQQIQGRDRRQWQKSKASHQPLGDLLGSAPPPRRRRGRTSEPSSGAGVDGVSAPAIPRSTSFDMLAQSTLVSSAAAAAKQSQATKRSRSWRRPKERASSSTGGSGDGGSDGGDAEEERVTISFRDAALVAWLNSVLFFEQNHQHPSGKTLR